MSNISVDSCYFNPLSRIFTPLVLDKIAEKGSSKYLTEILDNSDLINKIDLSTPFGTFLNDVYHFLSDNYRNEYLYKNEITKELLLNRHSLDESWMLNEFRVGKCRADAVILNGTSTVYEIKSQFDSFKRLDDQIEAYRNVFDHIYVVTSEVQATLLSGQLPEFVGIISIADDNSIKELKPSISNKCNISPDILFSSLRKNEYLEVINKMFGYIPDVPNTQIFNECKTLFCQQKPDIIHDNTIEILKKRNKKPAIELLLNEAPESLCAYIINNAGNIKKLKALSKKYDNEIKKVISPVWGE
jgi:hypothetical protein